MDNSLDELPTAELWMVCLHPAGGAKGSLYQLWRGLRRRGINAGLVTDLSGFDLPSSEHLLDLDDIPEIPVQRLVDSLEKVTTKKLYFYNIYTLPYFLPLVEEVETFFHFECWRGELINLLSLLQQGVENGKIEISDTVNVEAYEQISSHPVDSSKLPDLESTAFLQSYADALAASDRIASLVAEDIPLVEQVAATVGWDGNRVVHLPPLIDQRLFSPQDGVPPTERRLLVNGQKTHTPNARRNLSVTGDVLEENSSTWQLFIMGTTEDGSLVESTSEEKLSQLGSHDQVHRLPRVPYRDVPELYGRANIYALLSSESEGFSVSALEAMASGCVPVVSPFVARRMSPALHPGENCVIAGTSRSFEACIEWLVSNPDRIREKQDAAVKTINRHFSMSRLDEFPFFKL